MEKVFELNYKPKRANKGKVNVGNLTLIDCNNIKTKDWALTVDLAIEKNYNSDPKPNNYTQALHYMWDFDY